MTLRPHSFNNEQINRLFPFHILINKDLKAIALGKSLHKVCDFEKPQHINQFFSISSSVKAVNSFHDLIALQNQLVVLQLCSEKKLTLQGQFEYMEDSHEILFLGTPSFSSLEQVKESKLLTDDFAKSNQLINKLNDLHTVKTKNKELKEIVTTLKKHKVQLKTLNKVHYDSSLFSKQSLYPIIRINFEGGLMQSNPAASNLDFIEYERKTYPILEFLKIIAAKFVKKKEIWKCEAKVDTVYYSFLCIAMPVEGHINVYARNITEQKEQQQELKKLSLIVQKTMNAIIITSASGKIQWVNSAFEKLTGYNLNEIKGKVPGHFLQGKDTNLETVAYMREELKNSKAFTCEVYNYKKTGEGYWLRLKVEPIFSKSGKLINYFSVEEDITELKNLQEIEQSEKKYRDLINNSLAIIITHDLEGKILTSNPMAEKIYGYSDEEYLDHFISDFLFEDDKLLFQENYLEAIKTRKITRGTLRTLSKQGAIVYTLYNNYLMEEPGKEPYVISSAVDITKRILMEKELIRSKKVTEQLARSKHNFLANMSHEIRTPMNAIIGLSRQLKKSKLNDEQLSYLNIISTASGNLLVIINDILDLSKLEANKISFEKIPFKPNLVIDSALKVMRYKAQEKGIQLTNSYFDSTLWPVLLGDPHRINQILLNVISNAVKFTKIGGVDLSCTVLKEDATSQYLEINVTDTGIGMDSVFLETIFEKFTQEYETKAENFGGTGLGMAITKSLVDHMQGEISVESKINKGTTISIKFNLEKGEELDFNKKDSKVLTAANLKGKNILVVDDNMMNRMVANVILKDYQVNISEASNGEEAVNYLKNNTSDLILMDIQMPVLNGHQASKIIRDELKLEVPIIALTANVMKGEKEKCLEAGMNDYLSKPFDEEQFLQMISTWIGDSNDSIQTIKIE